MVSLTLVCCIAIATAGSTIDFLLLAVDSVCTLARRSALLAVRLDTTCFWMWWRRESRGTARAAQGDRVRHVGNGALMKRQNRVRWCIGRQRLRQLHGDRARDHVTLIFGSGISFAADR